MSSLQALEVLWGAFVRVKCRRDGKEKSSHGTSDGYTNQRGSNSSCLVVSYYCGIQLSYATLKVAKEILPAVLER